MPALHIVPFYAALLALLFVGLSMRAIRIRRRLRVAVGDAGDERMLRAMRVHANFAEYVPLSLLLFAFVENAGAAPPFVYGLCVCLLVGRLAHAYGVSQAPEPRSFRVVGITLTFFALIAAAVRLLLATL
jgi:hypothetical protein